jgi:hypothetical protein
MYFYPIPGWYGTHIGFEQRQIPDTARVTRSNLWLIKGGIIDLKNFLMVYILQPFNFYVKVPLALI